MSCVTEISVEFKLVHFDLLEEAVKAIKKPVTRGFGYISFFGTYGRITIYGKRIDLDERDIPHLNAVKRQYGRQILKIAAKECGWADHEVSKNRWLLRKRKLGGSPACTA